MANLYDIFGDDAMKLHRRRSTIQSQRFLRLIIERTELAFAAVGLPAESWRSYDTDRPPDSLPSAERKRLVYAQLAATLAERLLVHPPRTNRDMLLYLLGSCGEVAQGTDLGTALLKAAARDGGYNTPRQPTPYAAPLLKIAKEHIRALAARGELGLARLTEALVGDPRVAHLGMPSRRTRVKTPIDGLSRHTLRRWARLALDEYSKEQSGP